MQLNSYQITLQLVIKGAQSQLVETDMVASAVNQMIATIDGITANTTDAATKAQATNQSAL